MTPNKFEKLGRISMKHAQYAFCVTLQNYAQVLAKCTLTVVSRATTF